MSTITVPSLIINAIKVVNTLTPREKSVVFKGNETVIQKKKKKKKDSNKRKRKIGKKNHVHF